LIAPSIEQSYGETSAEKLTKMKDIPETKKSMTIIHEDERDLEISQFQRKDGV
jgi:hypothetical protein